MTGGIAHEHLCPIVVIVAGTAGNLEQAVAIVLATVGLIAAIKVGIVLRTHVATASPALVAHTDVLHFPRLFTAVLLTQLAFKHGW